MNNIMARFGRTSISTERGFTKTYRGVPTSALVEYGAPQIGVDEVNRHDKPPRRGVGKHSVDNAAEAVIQHEGGNLPRT